jgi:hypothetical protein
MGRDKSNYIVVWLMTISRLGLMPIQRTPAAASALPRPDTRPGTKNARASPLPTASNSMRSALSAAARTAAEPVLPASTSPVAAYSKVPMLLEESSSNGTCMKLRSAEWSAVQRCVGRPQPLVEDAGSHVQGRQTAMHFQHEPRAKAHLQQHGGHVPH